MTRNTLVSELVFYRACTIQPRIAKAKPRFAFAFGFTAGYRALSSRDSRLKLSMGICMYEPKYLALSHAGPSSGKVRGDDLEKIVDTAVVPMRWLRSINNIQSRAPLYSQRWKQRKLKLTFSKLWKRFFHSRRDSKLIMNKSINSHCDTSSSIKEHSLDGASFGLCVQ